MFNRKRLLQLMEELDLDDAPWVFVEHMIDQNVAVAGLKGAVIHGVGWIDFREATYAP